MLRDNPCTRRNKAAKEQWGWRLEGVWTKLGKGRVRQYRGVFIKYGVRNHLPTTYSHCFPLSHPHSSYSPHSIPQFPIPAFADSPQLTDLFLSFSTKIVNNYYKRLCRSLTSRKLYKSW